MGYGYSYRQVVKLPSNMHWDDPAGQPKGNAEGCDTSIFDSSYDRIMLWLAAEIAWSLAFFVVLAIPMKAFNAEGHAAIVAAMVAAITMGTVAHVVTACRR